ncbi:MAG: putative long-chain-fatty-acid-CoA ligase [Conexibacter sp.]|nr:putative long-chain-fatty-acid-CoA ligase [Conexibacter sp.]
MARASYAHGAHPTPLLADTIGGNLRRTAQRFPDREALVSLHERVRLTYAQLDAAVDAWAAGLVRWGVARGDRVGIWSPNCTEWVLLQYATARVGAVLVNINPAYRAGELRYVLAQAGVTVLFSAERHRSADYRAIVAEVGGELETLARVAFLGSDDVAELYRDCGPISLPGLDCDDAINIQYTSGTTGFPKGATLTHHNLLNNGFFVGELLGYDETDRVCIPVPFYHCFGMVMGNLACTSHGACIVIPAPSFEPGATLAAVRDERCTSLYGVPTMFIAELEQPGFDPTSLTSLRTGIMAGAPCPVDVMTRVVRDMHMAGVAICYGMTETSPVSTQTRSDDPLARRIGTVGQVSPHVEVKVIDAATGGVLPRGAIGELCTRGYSVMRGYWEEPERTAEAVDAAGWMHTGDLATMDDEGYVSIVGRSKDVVIRGGENIYPRELEDFLRGHPGVADVCVVGVPDDRYGEELCACLRVRAGSSIDADGVRAFCRDRIAHHKVPRYVLFRDQFPETVTGKVRKFKLREDVVVELGLGPGDGP